MEIFMQNISYSVTHHQLVQELAKVLHKPPYTEASALPLNFHIQLFKDRGGLKRHSGSGALTLPTSDAGVRFLADYGNAFSSLLINIGGRRLKFMKSRRVASREVVQSIRSRPYADPKTMEEKERRDKALSSGEVSIDTIQFGWECRDSVFSIEWEQTFKSACFLSFDGERREIRIKIHRPLETLVIAIRFSHIITLSAHYYLWEHPIIFLSLDTPPTFESDTRPPSLPRRRLPALPISGHDSIVPYASLAIRLVCTTSDDLNKLKELARLVQLHVSDGEYSITYRELFSSTALAELQRWLRRLDWRVSFQIEALVRSLAVDVREMLSLKSRIESMIDRKGISYTASMLRDFGPKARDFFWDPHNPSEQTIEACFVQAEEHYDLLSKSSSVEPTDGSLFDAYHAIVTPTTMYLEGPFLERSNRVIRKYDRRHNESFLRVSFVGEDHLQYRFDREIDGPAFVRSHVGPLLLRGLIVTHREFQFLAYSQSALKEHSVWCAHIT
jgi:RNA-dependent RNA polymerase